MSRAVSEFRNIVASRPAAVLVVRQADTSRIVVAVDSQDLEADGLEAVAVGLVPAAGEGHNGGAVAEVAPGERHGAVALLAVEDDLGEHARARLIEDVDGPGAIHGGHVGHGDGRVGHGLRHVLRERDVAPAVLRVRRPPRAVDRALGPLPEEVRPRRAPRALVPVRRQRRPGNPAVPVLDAIRILPPRRVQRLRRAYVAPV